MQCVHDHQCEHVPVVTDCSEFASTLPDDGIPPEFARVDVAVDNLDGVTAGALAGGDLTGAAALLPSEDCEETLLSSAKFARLNASGVWRDCNCAGSADGLVYPLLVTSSPSSVVLL